MLSVSTENNTDHHTHTHTYTQSVVWIQKCVWSVFDSEWLLLISLVSFYSCFLSTGRGPVLCVLSHLISMHVTHIFELWDANGVVARTEAQGQYPQLLTWERQRVNAVFTFIQVTFCADHFIIWNKAFHVNCGYFECRGCRHMNEALTQTHISVVW